MTSRNCPSCWRRIALWSSAIAFVLIIVATWVALSYLTVKFAEDARALANRKFEESRLWALEQLDATPSVVITEPATQASLDTILEAECRKQNVSCDLVRALIKVESDFKQDAIAFNSEGELKYGKMRSAAHSYMQVRGVWAGTNTCPDVKSWSDLYKPEVNIACGIRILKLNLASQPSLKLALAEYNGGNQCVVRGEIVCAESRKHSTLVLENLAEVIWKRSNA